MSNLPAKGKGLTAAWLREHVAYEGDDCLVWPFFRDRQNGYGALQVEGRSFWAHRLMCILAHGDPPIPTHTAAHSCGKGNRGCVNPRHLSWKTKSENQQDRRRHGTKSNAWWGSAGKLTPEQVVAIRALGGIRTQREIAGIFNVTDATVRDILSGRTWSKVRAASA